MTTLIFDIETGGIEATKIHMIRGTVLENGEKRVWLSDEAHDAARVPHDVLVCNHVEDFFDGATRVAGHNVIGYDCPIIEKLTEFRFDGLDIFDTQVAFRLWKPDAKQDFFTLLKKRIITKDDANGHSGIYSLKVCAKRVGSHKDQGPTDWSKPSQQMFDYCGQDVEATVAVYKAVKASGLSETALRLEMRFALVMRDMERNGFSFDVRAASELEAKLRSDLAEITAVCERDLPPTVEERWVRKPGAWNKKNFETYFGVGTTKEDVVRRYGAKETDWTSEKFIDTPHFTCDVIGAFWTKRTSSVPFNPGSRQQVYKYLQSLGWEAEEFTDGGDPRIDDAILEEAASSGKYPHADKIARYFMLTKRLGQIADGDNGWLKLVKDDGRMHGGVITIGTVTGRCAHLRPNMGQVPSVKKPYGKECRSLFSARPGWKLVGIDASGLQLRCLAHYLAPIDGGKYVDIVTTGDVHSANQKAAGLPTRNNAKTFIYAWLFGAGDEKIGSIVGGGKAAGAALKARFLQGLPQLAILKSRIEHAVKERGYLFGLDRRPLPVRSAHAALNTLLMAAEAVLVKTATVETARILSERFPGRFGFCAHVHDEMQIECDPAIADEVAAIGKQAVAESGKPYGFLCPLAGDAKIGFNWYDTH